MSSRKGKKDSTTVRDARDSGEGGGGDAPSRRRRARRDPQARRRAIVEATARLLLAEGAQRVTHRRIAEEAGVPLGSTTQYFSDIDELRQAGYELLSRQLETDYAMMFEMIDASGGDADGIAQVFCGYLGDSDEMRADMALYGAAAQEPRLRDLARKSNRLFIEGLCAYMTEEQARSVAVFMDGAVVHRSLFAEDFDEESVGAIIRSLMAPPRPPKSAAEAADRAGNR